VSKGGVVGYVVEDADRRSILGEFAEATLHLDWLSATAAARAVGGQIRPVVAAQPANADGPRRGRPKKEAAE
jgi:hypothetical protein